MTTAITTDAALTNDYPDELDDNAFVAALMDGAPEDGDDASEEKPSKKEAPAADEEHDGADEGDEEAPEETPEDETSDDEGDEDTEDDEGKDEEKSKKFADDDDTYVKVKEGDVEHEVSVKDLKRLWGQEAALTRKSQEVAAERKAIDEKRAANIAAYDVLLKKVTERADKYRALPWAALMKDQNVPAEQLQALQAEAQEAVQEETFLKTELGNFMQAVAKEQAEAQRKAAQECVKALNNPESKSHIKGWNDAVYNDIRKFATDEIGISAETVNGITDAGAIKVLHMAMQFARGKTKVVTKKVNKTPTKIVKSTAAAPAARGSAAQATAKSAVKKAVKSGSMEDAAHAFEALMGDD